MFHGTPVSCDRDSGVFYILGGFLRFVGISTLWGFLGFLRLAAYGLSPKIFSRGYNVTKLLSFARCLDTCSGKLYYVGEPRNKNI